MKSVVLLSGGLDSTTNLYWAQKSGEVCLALSFNYGQRAFAKEQEAAEFFCNDLGIPLKTISIDWFKDFGQSSLIDHKLIVPTGKNVAIDDLQQSLKTAKSVWVPNCNGIFLNIAAGFAESLGASHIIPGFNREEAATFPDNSQAFVQAINHSLNFSTSLEGRVQCHCFTINDDKIAIVRRAVELHIDLKRLWPVSPYEFQSMLGLAEIFEDL